MEVVNRPIRIRMELNYASFGESMKQEFLSDLSDVSGVPLNEISVTGFYSGCVIFEGELNKEAIARLVEQFKRIEKNKDVQELTLLISNSRRITKVAQLLHSHSQWSQYRVTMSANSTIFIVDSFQTRRQNSTHLSA